MIERDDARREALFNELAKTGSAAVRNELVESFAPLAEYFAKRYRNRGAEDQDLRQVAQLALVKAVDRFDPSFGVQFSTFAGRTIDGELKRYFRDKTWSVRVPRSLQEISLEIRRLIDDMSNDLGRAPTIDELAERSGYDSDRVLEALDVHAAYRADSIDRGTAGDDDAPNLAGTLGVTDRGFDQSEAALAMQSLLETLPDRERRIIELRFFGEMSQNEIADEVGLSQMHVSRLLRRSLDHLRQYFDE